MMPFESSPMLLLKPRGSIFGRCQPTLMHRAASFSWILLQSLAPILLQVFLTVFAGLSIGAKISQKMAAFLEENELFVPEDDDDDDDDD